MTEARFKIVFEKLEEMAESCDKAKDSLKSEVDALTPELEEIAELRRLVTELSDPPSTSYTST